MFKVYILKSELDQGYYVGFTSDLISRIARHNEGREKSTKRRRPFKLVFSKDFIDKSEALKYEKFLKRQKSKAFIDKLILNQGWDRSSTG